MKAIFPHQLIWTLGLGTGLWQWHSPHYKMNFEEHLRRFLKVMNVVKIRIMEELDNVLPFSSTWGTHW